MATALSARLRAIVDALPLRPGMRVLEIGCGTGSAARAVAARVGDGHVLAIDRSRTAIAQTRAHSRAEIAAGLMSVRCVALEDLELEDGEDRYDLAFAVRVGVLDGRHPGDRAFEAIERMLTKKGLLYIDGQPARRIQRPRRFSVKPAPRS